MAKTPHSQGRWHGFDSWSGNIQHAAWCPPPPKKMVECLRKERPTEIICADWGIMSVMAVNEIKTRDVAARVLQRNGNWAFVSR